jgi:hypothetical protein
MNLDWGSFFSSGVEEIGEIAKAKDVSIKAEAKASAEEFAEKQESYNNDITTNKQALTKEVESISGLVNGDVGKIRTIMKTYGNADVVKQLQTDFEKYQTNAYFETPTTGPQFKTLSEYVNGKISGAGTAIISDKAAEQVNDENAIAGNELNMVKAAKDAKAQGVSLSDYLDNQARRMSTRPAFSVDAKAARLVEESKMGIFGKTLTMEEARQKVTGGQVIGEDAKDLGDTGFALAREGNLSAEQIYKITSGREKMDKEKGIVNAESEIRPVRNDVAKFLSKIGDGELTELQADGNTYVIKRTPNAIKAAIEQIDIRISNSNDRKSKSLLEDVKKEFQQMLTENKTFKKPNAAQIEYLKNNPNTREKFIEKFGIENLPPQLKEEKEEIKDDNPYDSSTKTERVIDSEGNAPKRPPSSFLTKPSEKKARDEWDKLYGDDYYVNGKPKPKQK